MKTTTLEEWLKEWYENKIATGVLDDDLSDAFEHWLTQLDTEELLSLGEIYGLDQYTNGLKKCQEIMK